MLRVKRADLDRRGVRRVEHRVVAVRGGRPELADGTVADVRNVIWCTGFRQAFEWIHLPILRGGRLAGRDAWVWSRPRRACTSAAWPSSTRSAPWCCPASARDAEYLARHIGSRRPSDAVVLQAG
jgi:putative flavoprotein involved in K+ transport